MAMNEDDVEDAVSYSSDFSYDSPLEDEEDVDFRKNKDRHPGPSVEWQGEKQLQRTKGKKNQGHRKWKTCSTVKPQTSKLPPITPQQGTNARAQSFNLHCIRELKSQVRDLEQQLSEVRTENKVLKRLQHRHTMALQYYQVSEGSISQMITKHDNETRVLQEQLRNTRACRDSLARQLKATNTRLLNTKTSLHHLQLLSENHSLLEREQLTVKLAKATTELEEKDKRILEMKKNLGLCQASFNRQIVTEQRKLKEARGISFFLQEHIQLLTQELQAREKELEKHNIYYQRFFKASSKKGRENKKVQTDESKLQPVNATTLLETQDTQTVDKLKEQEISVISCDEKPEHCSDIIEHQELEVSPNVAQQNDPQDVLPMPTPPIPQREKHVEDPETCTDTSEERICLEEIICSEERIWPEEIICLEESPKLQPEKDCPDPEESSGVPQAIEEKLDTDPKTEVDDTSEACLKLANIKRKECILPRIKPHYIFSQSVENLHNGRPSYSSGDMSPHGSRRSKMTMDILSSEIQELRLNPSVKSKRGGNGGFYGD